jgi:hypothetical protein
LTPMTSSVMTMSSVRTLSVLSTDSLEANAEADDQQWKHFEEIV